MLLEILVHRNLQLHLLRVIFIFTNNTKVVSWYLVVLVGGDCDKLGLGENKGVLPSTPPQHVSGFNHMNSGLVAMQRM